MYVDDFIPYLDRPNYECSLSRVLESQFPPKSSPVNSLAGSSSLMFHQFPLFLLLGSVKFFAFVEYDPLS